MVIEKIYSPFSILVLSYLVGIIILYEYIFLGIKGVWKYSQNKLNRGDKTWVEVAAKEKGVKRQKKNL